MESPGRAVAPENRRGAPADGTAAPDACPGRASPDSDRDLLAAVADGDREALRVLYERHAPWLFARLAHRCGDRDAVEEALQETFVAVWRGAGGYRGEGQVGAWLWGIAIRRLVDRLRRRRLPTVPFREHHAPVLASAEDRILASVEHGDLAGALDRLSPELRAVIQATVLDGLTTREAAGLLGIPRGTVKTRAMRARAQLRAALIEEVPA